MYSYFLMAVPNWRQFINLFVHSWTCFWVYFSIKNIFCVRCYSVFIFVWMYYWWKRVWGLCPSCMDFVPFSDTWSHSLKKYKRLSWPFWYRFPANMVFCMLVEEMYVAKLLPGKWQILKEKIYSTIFPFSFSGKNLKSPPPPLSMAFFSFLKNHIKSLKWGERTSLVMIILHHPYIAWWVIGCSIDSRETRHSGLTWSVLIPHPTLPYHHTLWWGSGFDCFNVQQSCDMINESMWESQMMEPWMLVICLGAAARLCQGQAASSTNPPCSHGIPSKIAQVKKQGANQVNFISFHWVASFLWGKIYQNN